MEVPGIMAFVGYLCLAGIVSFVLLVVGFAILPTDWLECFLRRASGQDRTNPAAWREFVLHLVAGMVIDGVGCMSFALPGIGEAGDIAWAPISAMMVKQMFNSNIWASINFIEEALPFMDIIPTATFAWAWKYWPFILTTLHRAIPSVRVR